MAALTCPAMVGDPPDVVRRGGFPSGKIIEVWQQVLAEVREAIARHGIVTERDDPVWISCHGVAPNLEIEHLVSGTAHIVTVFYGAVTVKTTLIGLAVTNLATDVCVLTVMRARVVIGQRRVTVSTRRFASHLPAVGIVLAVTVQVILVTI